MRVAVISHGPTEGGINRFTLALIDALVLARPDIEIGFFINGEVAARDGIERLYAKSDRVRVVPFMDPDVGAYYSPIVGQAAHAWPKSPAWRLARRLAKSSPITHEWGLRGVNAYRRWIRRRGKPWYQFRFPAAIVRQIEQYDIAYSANPFFMAPVHFAIPFLGTFHDLNYKHFGRNFPPDMLAIIERQMPYWIHESVRVISSTRVIESEIVAHYPEAQHKTSVVYLAPYSYDETLHQRAAAVVQRSGLPDRYLVYPANRSTHKNILSLVKAMGLLKAQGRAIPLVVTGGGTDLIASAAELQDDDPLKAVRRAMDDGGLALGRDVFALGYVSDEQVDAITHQATMVVSTSLYEAGCGPAMDAWQWGVPVAFSNIPPFIEQLDALNVQAWVFDPLDPANIADVIGDALSSPRTEDMVRQSSEAISRYTWADVARGYLTAFDAALPLT